MRKQIFGLTLSAMLFAPGFSAQAQQSKVHRVGVVVVGSADIPLINGLRDGLKELEYIPGNNLALDVAAKESYEELRPLVKSYKEKKVDAMVTIGGTATGVVKDIAPEIPTVFFVVRTQCRRDSLDHSRVPKPILPA